MKKTVITEYVETLIRQLNELDIHTDFSNVNRNIKRCYNLLEDWGFVLDEDEIKVIEDYMDKAERWCNNCS